MYAGPIKDIDTCIIAEVDRKLKYVAFQQIGFLTIEEIVLENKVQRIITKVNDEENELEQDWADIQSHQNYQLAKEQVGETR